MDFRRYAPPPLLAPWVECFWTLRAPALSPQIAVDRIVPDGCMELIFNLASPVRVAIGGSPWRRQPRAVLVGQITRYLELRHEGSCEIVAARFTPLGAAGFFRFSLRELADREVALPDLHRAWSELEEQLAEIPADAARVRRLEEALLSLWAETAPERSQPLQRAIAAMRSTRGTAPIGSVARQAGYSERQLERVFDHTVGLGPKQFSRIVRFQALLRELPGGAPRWAEAAFEAGLTDQAHLVREFQRFAGQSPTGWLAARSAFGEAMRI